jgi:hypothetical protein
MRSRLYAAIAVAFIAIVAVVHHFWSTTVALFASELVVTSLANAVIYACVQADVDGAEPATIWARALERAWAVVVFTIVQWVFLSFGQSLIVFGGDLLNRGFGIIALMMGLTLIFADVDAVVSEDDRWWLLVPTGLTNSIRAVWTGSTMLRVIGVFLVSFLLQELAASTQFVAWLQGIRIHDAAFWAATVLDALMLAPFGILTVLIYFDAIGYESKRPCGE